MVTQPTLDPQHATSQLFAMLKSVGEFDEIEIRPVLCGLISPTDRENCFLGIYHRAVANIATLRILHKSRHFQAIAMITRSLFELAVDVRLIDLIVDAIPKMLIFPEVEHLRCARKIVAFKAANPTTAIDDSNYASFIASEEKSILTKKATLWPGVSRIEHWSCERLDKRVSRLGSPFNEVYQVRYPLLSWYVHAGLTGIVGVKADTFMALCGVAVKTSVDAYEQLLLAMVDEFKIGKADGNIKNKLLAAKLVPFADSQEEADKLFRQLLH